MATWYPQCWVRIGLRPEDFTRTIGLPTPDPGSVPSDPTSKGLPPALTKAIIPTFCSVALRSYREGDECVIEIPASALPIDPRVIRAGTVHVYMGTLDARTFAETQGELGSAAKVVLLPEFDPVTGKSNEVFRGLFDDMEITLDGDDMVRIQARDATSIFIDSEFPTGALRGIPKSMPIDQVIQAIVDGEPGAAFMPPPEPGEAQRRVESRRDAKRLTHQHAAVTRKLAKVVAAAAADPTDTSTGAEIARLTAKLAVLAADLGVANALATAFGGTLVHQRLGLPGARGMKVVNNTGAPLRTIGELKGATWFDSLGTAKKGRASAGSQRISYWDFITDLCVGSGYIVYIRTPPAPLTGVLPPAEIVIDLPRTYYPELAGENRRFVYGQNVDSLQINRSFSGRDIPQAITVSAMVDETGEPISVTYPPIPVRPTNRSSTSPIGQGDRIETTAINLRDRIPAAQATSVLTQIAQSLYEQLGRGEMEVAIETDILAALPSSALTGFADMLKLRAADTIEVEVALRSDDEAEPVVTSFGGFSSMSMADKVDRLVRFAGFPPAIAAQIATAYESVLLQRRFRVREHLIEFTSDDETGGFQFTIQGINYLDARHKVLTV